MENEMADPNYHREPDGVPERQTFSLADALKGLKPSEPPYTIIDLRNGWLKLKVDCIECKKTYFLDADKQAYHRWQGGELIQNALPTLDEGQRELLISGICEACFDKLFAEDPEVQSDDEPADPPGWEGGFAPNH